MTDITESDALNTYITADHHFFHHNIIEYTGRPFKSVGEMNETMIKRWNEVVGSGDVVFHLGDMGFKSGEENKYNRTIERLNGQIIWIKGNHDPNLPEDRLPKNVIWMGLSNVLIYKEYKFLLVHRPIEASDRIPTMCGHVHEKWKILKPGDVISEYRSKRNRNLKQCVVNVGVDVWDFRPIRIEQVIELIEGVV